VDEKARFAHRVFLSAGIYGLLVITPLFFLEQFVGRKNPPLITHPEFYYGFAGAALAWQVLFLFISRDPIRYRPLMLPSVLEKLLYPAATCFLRLQHRVDAATFTSAWPTLFSCCSSLPVTFARRLGIARWLLRVQSNSEVAKDLRVNKIL
jgi:hypothetical protein